MKKMFKKAMYVLGILIAATLLVGLVLAYSPIPQKMSHKSLTEETAAVMRREFKGTHHQFTTTDNQTLFLRRWNPDSLDVTKKDVAVILFHGFTAHSGAGPYDRAAHIIAKGGFTTFGLDYRGHGLSGGNRGDCPSRERWQADLTESVRYVKSLGFSKVIVWGHSLGVAAAMYATMAIPEEVSGLILLSGAYEGRKGLSKPVPYFDKARIVSSSVFRPSFPVVEYYRDGMSSTDDSLFNFHYTLRYMTMLDVKTLKLPKQLNIPVLVAVGDKDELFEIDKVKDFYNEVPCDKKTFLVLPDTYHAKFPDASWGELLKWLENNF